MDRSVLHFGQRRVTADVVTSASEDAIGGKIVRISQRGSFDLVLRLLLTRQRQRQVPVTALFCANDGEPLALPTLLRLADVALALKLELLLEILLTLGVR